MSPDKPDEIVGAAVGENAEFALPSDIDWPTNAQGHTFPQLMSKFVTREVMREQQAGRTVPLTPEQLSAIVWAWWSGDITRVAAAHLFRAACDAERDARTASPAP